MKSYLLLFFLPVIITTTACRQKEKKEEKKYISVISLIRKDVAHVDTSLYSIMKVVSTDSLHSDTTWISREKFAEAAVEFLEIPDLSDKKVAKRYKEEPAVFDELLNRAIITYTPVEPEKEEFKKQELLATPVPGADAIVNNIIIIREINTRDSFLRKNMLWQLNKSFQVVTTSQKPGKPHITTTTKVTWNEDPDQ